METRFLIIDGNSLACRAAFAHNPKFGSDLMTSTGKITGGTYRFFTMFDRILHKFNPTHILVAWDVGRETFRNALDSEYKSNREPRSEDLYVQFSDIKRILNAIGILNFGVLGYEGDDIIGTYVKLSNADKNFIITGDKDSFQLVNHNTIVIYPNNGFKDVKIINPDYILEKYGITVDKFTDLKALIGDTSDNIKGIEGCGEKTATKLLNHYGNVDNIIDNANNINLKGVNKRVKKNIIEWAERSEIVKQLVKIRDDVPVSYSFDDCIMHVSWENARELFEEYEFNNFIRKLNSGDFYGQK